MRDSMRYSDLLKLHLPLFKSALPAEDVLAILSCCQRVHGIRRWSLGRVVGPGTELH